MTNKQLGPVVRAWLKRTDVGPEDARRSTSHVSARVEQTHQRGRWWPLPSFRRPPGPPKTNQSNGFVPTPIPAMNGHSPTVLGRTQSMLSPVKAITAAALVFALGGMFLIAQPFGQQSGPPGAASDLDPIEVAAWVTGTVTEVRSDDTDHLGDVRVLQEGKSANDGVHLTSHWAASDPRLTGSGTYDSNWHSYLFQDMKVEASRYTVQNDEGQWVGTGTTVASSSDIVDTHTIILRGEGGYEGLTTYVVMDNGPSPASFYAAIFPGDMPAAPDTAQ